MSRRSGIAGACSATPKVGDGGAQVGAYLARLGDNVGKTVRGSKKVGDFDGRQ